MNTIDEYQYKVAYSEEDQAFVATVSEFPYLSADGTNQMEAIAELQSVVAASIEILVEAGKEIPQPLSRREYKGNISLRLSPEIHRIVVARAREEGSSLNQFLTSLIERNLYADKIEEAVQSLKMVVADLEVTQVIQQLSSWPAQYATGGQQQIPCVSPRPYQSFGGQLATDIPMFNSMRQEVRSV